VVERRAAAVGPGVEVTGRELEHAAVGGLEGEGAVFEVDCGDGGAGAVEDVEAARVAQRHHPIADGKHATVDVELCVAEVLPGAHAVAGTGVEIGDVVAAGGDHHRLLPARVLGGFPPILDEPLPHPARGVCHDEPAVTSVGGECGGGGSFA